MKLSNPLLTVFFLFSLISVLLLSLSHQRYYNVPDKSAISEGLTEEKANTMIEQGTKFIHALVTPSTGPPDGCCADVAELDKLAQAQTKKESQSHYRHRMSYWKSIPVAENEYVILIWQDVKQNEYDWIAVKDTPAFWYTIRKNGRINFVLDGQQMVCEWHVNKKYLEIRVNNPPNIKGWTPFDFLYSFAENEIKPTRNQIGLVSWLSDIVDNTCHNETD